MRIEPTDFVDGSYRTGGLQCLTAADITLALGFAPSVEDDPDKVIFFWAFEIDGEPAAIWDYKGSHLDREWSLYDPSGKAADYFLTIKGF